MGFAAVIRPPVTPTVASDVRDLPAFGVRMAAAINQARAGDLTVTLQIRLAQGDTTTVVQDSRIGLWTFCGPMPLSAGAEAKMSGMWFELHQGSLTIHHSATGAAEVDEYILLLIG